MTVSVSGSGSVSGSQYSVVREPPAVTVTGHVLLRRRADRGTPALALSNELQVVDEKMRRGRAFRQLLVFLGKLFLDGSKDFVLAGASIVVGGISILRGGQNPEAGLHQVMQWGKKFDDAVGLYSAVEPEKGPSLVDRSVDRAEASLRAGASRDPEDQGSSK